MGLMCRTIVHVDMHRTPRVRAVLDFLQTIVEEHAAALEGIRPS